MYGYSYPAASMAAPSYSTFQQQAAFPGQPSGLFQQPAVFQQQAAFAVQQPAGFAAQQYFSAAPTGVFSAAPAVSYGYPATTFGAPSAFGFPGFSTVGAPFGGAFAAEPAKPAIKLTYFDGPGRGEHTRVTLFVAGIQFEDAHLTMDEFKAEGGLKERATFGQLPILEVAGQMIAQSYAQLLFVGELAGLYPQDAWQRAKVNEAIFLGEDLVQAILPIRLEKDEERKAAKLAKAVAEDIPKQLANLEKLLVENGSGYLAGPSMTIADISLWHYLLNFIQGGQSKELVESIDLAQYPKLNEFQARMNAHPRIAEWVAKEKARKEAKAAAETAAKEVAAAEAPVATEEAAQE